VSDPSELWVKHLEFIEDVISRQARNSFAVKGWSISLSAAILTFLLSQEAVTNFHSAAYFIAFLPAVIFWLLDGYYLYQERSFRCLYDDVRQNLINEKSEQTIQIFEMDVARYKNSGTYLRAICSKSVYGIPLLIILTSIGLFACSTI